MFQLTKIYFLIQVMNVLSDMHDNIMQLCCILIGQDIIFQLMSAILDQINSVSQDSTVQEILRRF